MSPGGHLVTTAGACAAAAVLLGDWTLAAGVAAGGFLIDVDHAVDYVLVDGQRDLRPGAFLRYYLEGRMRRTVLVLHSYELFALLLAAAALTDAPWLWGYLLGGLMHLALDLAVNGEVTPRSIAAFYSFGYRLAHRFDAAALLGRVERRRAPAGFWRTFFTGAGRAAC
ncbi:MAG TPA: hypothetical protein VFX28_10820 [Methylomirabilota bacterium]|nr:hypothetical protein [Methylomirabilota bacterium]